MDNLVDRVLDRLGINDGIYEFLMEDFNIAMRRKQVISYAPNQGKISLIKILREYFNYGLKDTKDATEGSIVLRGYLTAALRDRLSAELERFRLAPDNYILTKKEEN